MAKDINLVLSWLEGLTEDDWADYHSDSEVQNIAKSAMELLEEQNEKLEEQEPVEPRIQTSYDGKGTWWYTCGSCNKAISPKDKYCRECGRELKWNDP